MQNKYLYRIFRLRRLAATSLILLFSGWFVGELLFGPADILANSIIKAGVALVCSAAVIGLILVYPRVWWETICAAMALGLLLMFLPLIETLPEYMPRDEGVMAVLWVIFIVVFGGIFLWLGLYLSMLVLYVIPSFTTRDKSRLHVRFPVDKAFEVLKIKPNSDDGFHKTSPVEPDGFFTVSFEANSFDPDSYLPITETLTVRARIEEEGKHFQVNTFGCDIDGELTLEVQTLIVRQARGRTLCESISQKSESNLFESIGFWMQDFGSDHLVSHLIKSQGVKSFCIRDLPYRSPMYDLARYFGGRNSGTGSHNPEY